MLVPSLNCVLFGDVMCMEAQPPPPFRTTASHVQLLGGVIAVPSQLQLLLELSCPKTACLPKTTALSGGSPHPKLGH